MGIKAVKLPYRVLQFVLWVAAVESFSSHFGVNIRPLETPFQKELSSSSSRNFRRWTVLERFSKRRRNQNSLFSSRQPYDEADDGYNDLRSPKTREPSPEEIRLRKMAKNSESRYEDDESNFYEDDRQMARPSASRNGRLATYDNSYDDYDDFYDDEEEDDDEDDYYEDDGPMPGNFWSNPEAKTSWRERQPRRYYEEEEDDLRRRPRRRQSDRPARRRSPAPTSFGEPPKVFKEFYDQLFWYGFDIDESAKVGDNTVFGGTKGKFNGFNYLLPEEDDGERSRPSRNPARRLPPSRNGKSGTLARNSGRRPRRDVESDYYLSGDGDEYDDDDEDDDYDEFEEPIKKRKPRTSSEYTPPTDRTATRYDPIDDYDDYDNYDEDEYMDTRRRSRRKSSSRYNDDDEYNDRRSGGRRRRRQQSSGTEWSPLNMIESFLGIDRDEMNYKADEYNAKMGLRKRRLSSGDDERNSRRRSPSRRRSARDDPERPGYAYRYDATLDDESTPILDVDLAEAEDSNIPESKRRQLSLDSDETKSPKKERSWEFRLKDPRS